MSSSAPNFIPAGLPALTPHLAARLDQMVALLREQINYAGGSISFADYMNNALYAPEIGYYTGGLHKFGSAGDFITAPEISPLFGRCVARQITEVLSQIPDGEILEVGAGSGLLAKEILQTLFALGTLPRRYLILELSSELRARQAELFTTQIPELCEYIEWRSDLPDFSWNGIIIANEFLDALPVYRFGLTNQGILEHRVTWGANGFEWCQLPPTGHLATALNEWQLNYGENLDYGYNSELALAAPGWLTTCAERLMCGAILFIDYGYPAREYYHPARSDGTLVCHYQHRRHDNPLILPGLQDITAHVNFTALAAAGDTAGLKVAGYTTQGYFLLATGITEYFSQATNNDAQTQLSLANQIRRLTLPNEMGELFKVIALTRGIESELGGFQTYDLRNRL